MTEKKIGVGIVGIGATRGWGSTVHLPALRSLPQFEVVAVATTRQSSADEVAKSFNISHAFGNPKQLFECPDVDVVAVTVKVPSHFQLVMDALNAGKHVYCEWPLGAITNQAVEMCDLARRKHLLHMVGLQARGSPAVNYLRDLVADGYVGDVLSCTMLSVVPRWGLGTEAANLYTLDRNSHANILTIASGHSLDILCNVLGEFQDITATVAVRRRQTVVADSGDTIDVTSPDQVAITGQLQSGAVVSAHIQGGTPHATKFLFEINGTQGSLVLSDRGPLSAQMAPLKLCGVRSLDGSLSELSIPNRYCWVPTSIPDGPQFNVAQLYARLGEAIRTGVLAEPDFEVAVLRHKMIDAIERASDTGMRQSDFM